MTTTAPDPTAPVVDGPHAGSLAAVPRLLRADPALAGLSGAADATVAVPEAAQAVRRRPRWRPSASGALSWW